MTYIQHAKEMFEKLCNTAPAYGCLVKKDQNHTILDMGINAAGGWSSVKLLLDAMIGGLGIINISRDFRGVHQFPAVEIMFDDPVSTYKNICSTKDTFGLLDSNSSDSYAFGISITDDASSISAKGNVAVMKQASLSYCAVNSLKTMSDAVSLLLDSGIKEDYILWGWSFTPIADLSLNNTVTKENILKIENRRIASLWVRSDDETLQNIVKKYTPGTLRLHNLVTAKTIMVEGPAAALNC